MKDYYFERIVLEGNYAKDISVCHTYGIKFCNHRFCQRCLEIHLLRCVIYGELRNEFNQHTAYSAKYHLFVCPLMDCKRYLFVPHVESLLPPLLYSQYGELKATIRARGFKALKFHRCPTCGHQLAVAGNANLSGCQQPCFHCHFKPYWYPTNHLTLSLPFCGFVSKKNVRRKFLSVWRKRYFVLYTGILFSSIKPPFYSPIGNDHSEKVLFLLNTFPKPILLDEGVKDNFYCFSLTYLEKQYLFGLDSILEKVAWLEAISSYLRN